jgi:hypothetical protein
MGFFSAIGGFIGGALGKINDTNIKKEETEFEKTQKYIKELEEKMEREKNLKPESKLKNINLDEGEKKLNWQDLRSKQNIKEDLAKEKEEEDKWKKLDKMLEDI